MSRHGEKIRKRKDGRWEGRYKIGNKENGATAYASVYGKTYAEAKENLTKAVMSMRLPLATLKTETFFVGGTGMA